MRNTDLSIWVGFLPADRRRCRGLRRQIVRSAQVAGSAATISSEHGTGVIGSSSPTITSRLRKNLKNGRLLSNCAVSTGSKNPFVRNLLEPAIFNYVSSDVMNALQAKDAARFHHLLMLLVSLAAEPHYFKHPLLNQTPALVAGIASPHAAGLRALPAVVATGDIGRNHN